MKQENIRRAVLGRVPMYLQFLRSIPQGGNGWISASTIARSIGLGEVQVRKDLQTLSGVGKPRVGYEISELKTRLEEVIGCNHLDSAIIVGAGKLGMALLNYDGFREYGIVISAAFDADSAKIGRLPSGKEVYPLSHLKDYCAENGVKIGIITVPGYAAQSVCDKLTDAGITAVWSFAPRQLTVPEGVLLKQENLALSLAHLKVQMDQ